MTSVLGSLHSAQRAHHSTDGNVAYLNAVGKIQNHKPKITATSQCFYKVGSSAVCKTEHLNKDVSVARGGCVL